MTKTRINQFLIVTCILIMTSCSVSTSSKKSNIDIEEVLGSWDITESSLEKIKSENKKPEDKIITSFKLNSDSTATVSFEGAEEKIIDGTWIWQAEKKIGNNKFGISINSDVVIRVTGYTLGLQLNQERGQNNLTVNDYTFEKQK